MSKRIPTLFAGLFATLSVLGVIDAGYLTIEHFRGVAPTCNILHGCDIVTSSVYSEVLGVPIALLGLFYYLGLLVLSLWYLDRKDERALLAAMRCTPIGLLAAIYLVSLQAFVLHAWCQWCLGSAITSTLLFLLSWFLLVRYVPEPAPKR